MTCLKSNRAQTEPNRNLFVPITGMNQHENDEHDHDDDAGDGYKDDDVDYDYDDYAVVACHVNKAMRANNSINTRYTLTIYVESCLRAASVRPPSCLSHLLEHSHTHMSAWQPVTMQDSWRIVVAVAAAVGRQGCQNFWVIHRLS